MHSTVQTAKKKKTTKWIPLWASLIKENMFLNGKEIIQGH